MFIFVFDSELELQLLVLHFLPHLVELFLLLLHISLPCLLLVLVLFPILLEGFLGFFDNGIRVKLMLFLESSGHVFVAVASGDYRWLEVVGVDLNDSSC